MSRDTPEISITSDWKRISPEAFYDVYDSVNFGLGQRDMLSDRYLEEVFPPGVYGVFAHAGDELVGAARIFSDDKYCSWIAEICVRPEWQNKGVGKAMIDHLNERFSHTALYGEVFRDQAGFFTKMGIKPKEKLVACSRAPISAPANA